MKISTLLEREPFPKLFEQTMTLFLDDLYGIKHTVKWRGEAVSVETYDQSEYWYCNPAINSVFARNANPAIFNSINGEYSYNPIRPWLSLVQKVYLFFSQIKLTSVLLASQKIYISPPIHDSKNKLIIGGNTKIRLIDILNRKVYVILKDGFDKKYINRELYVRKNFTYLPVPKISVIGSNNTWYSEEYVIGNPPNRMLNSQRNTIITSAVQDIHKMLNETKMQVSINEYVSSLNDRVSLLLLSKVFAGTEVKKKILSISKQITEFIIKDSQEFITTAYCHGDFHEGNILSSANEYWILDWENSGRGQICYDLFILLIGSRIEKVFFKNFSKIANNDLDVNQRKLIHNWPEIDWSDVNSRKVYLVTFLLEDIIFHIDEKNNALFFKDPVVLSNRCKELELTLGEII
jgi:hypothetical protein